MPDETPTPGAPDASMPPPVTSAPSDASIVGPTDAPGVGHDTVALDTTPDNAPGLSATRDGVSLAVFGRGFEPNASYEIQVDGVKYAGQRTEPDGTFRRLVPDGKRVSIVGPHGEVARVDVS